MSSTSNTGIPTATQLRSLRYGYCHNCDRQVPINIEGFTCTVCNSGFVELLDEESTNQK